MSKRVSYLLADFGYTGGNLVLYNFMDKLCERGYTVFAVAPYETISWKPGFSSHVIRKKYQGVKYKLVERVTRLGKPWAKRMRLIDCVGRKILGKPPSDIVQQIKWLTERLVRNCPKSDIVIATYHTTAFAAYLLMENAVPFYHIQHYEELFKQDDLGRKVARLTYYMPLILIANSTWLQEQIKKRFGREPYLLKPGIDTSVFRPYYDLAIKYKNANPVRILSYCSLAKFKAWDEAVKGMEIVFKVLGDKRIEWVVFGETPPKQPNVPCKFVGKVFGESLARLYSSAHIVFMNSWYESFPLPPLEAMACGTAVVTTRFGTEDYAFDKINSMVIPPGEPLLLAEAIVYLVENMDFTKQLAQAGIETAVQFTWDCAADHLEEILHIGIDNFPSETFSDIPDLIRGKFSK
ncbi:MAG: glycosyltransferase family 4 protein [Candidatus Methanomethylicaceae archaeon]